MRACIQRVSQARVELPDENNRVSGQIQKGFLILLGVLVISQFTLFANPYRGNRPSFIDAAPPERARELYRFFIQELKQKGITVEEGVFQANMAVHLTNDGPVTIWIDSRDRFLKS